MNSKILSIIIILCAFAACKKAPVDYVNPFIGTENSIRPSLWEANGGTYPGAVVPFGMVQVSPEDYHFNTLKIKSFSLLNHTSGYPHGSKGNFQIMPFSGHFTDLKNTGSAFQHEKENAKPGYYSVFLEDYGINSEMTASEHVAFFRFTFQNQESNSILLHDIEDFSIDENGKISGKSHGHYFVLKLNGKIIDVESDRTKTIIALDGNQPEVLLKIGVSLTSNEKASENLKAEVQGWDFEAMKQNASKQWNRQLSRIIVEGSGETDKELFYTALYHTYLAPQIITDHGEPKRYAGLSPWDTYKCKQPLLTMLNPQIQADMVQSVLEQYNRDGVMNPGPMTGVHNVPILLDSYVKGIEMDADLAYSAMKASLVNAPFGRRDINSFYVGDYVPAEKSYSVTKTLEYAYNFWAMAEMARELGKMEDYRSLIEKSTFHRNIYNPDTKFMTAKTSDGRWEKGGYREGDKWAYNWSAVHDIQGLINLAGGNREFVSQLDSCFNTGKYFHDNEPPLHNAYLYSYAGQPWKTQETVRNILRMNYSNNPGGISGNDDLGALSAWYVFSSMGFFPVCPGRPEYVIGAPLFEKVSIYPEDGAPFVIHAKNSGKENTFVQAQKLNGAEFDNLWIGHSDLISGGLLELEMGPNEVVREIETKYLPKSETTNKPDFTIQNWKLSKNRVGADELFEIVVEITNDGTCAGSVPVNIFLNGELEKAKWFLIDGKTKLVVSVPLKLYQPGEYEIRVDEQESESIDVVADKKATLRYQDLILPSPPLVKLNDEVVIQTNIKNTGSFSRKEKVELFKNGKSIDTLSVQLKPGETRDLKFKTTFSEEGLYDIKIGETQSEQILVYGPDFSEKAVYSKDVKPIMAFDFNESGVKSIKDYSEVKNNAIVHGGVQWVDGIFGKAIKTNAYNEAYVEIPNHPKYDKIADGKIMTIMLWIYPMDEKNFADIISKGDLNVIQVRASNTELNYYSGGYQRGEAYTLLPEDWNRNWHNLAGVSDGRTLKLYIDGKLMVTKLLEKNIDFTGTTPYPWNIGRNAANTDRVFDGYIDQLMIFDKALNQNDIKEFMLFIKD